MLCAIASNAALAATPTSQPVKPVVREASRGPIKLRVEVDRDEVQMPQTVKMTLSIEAEKGVKLEAPKIGETLGDFSVKETSDLSVERGDVSERIGKAITLEPVVAGPSKIPGVKLTFKDAREKADGSKEPYEDSVETEPITVAVHGDLADVKGPVSLPWSRSLVLILWAAGLLAGTVLAIWLLRRWARRRAMEPVEARVVPAHEWALAELDMLASEGLIERGKVQEFYYRINAIVRGYIERRWGLNAGEQTSEEFIRELQRSVFLNDAHKVVLRRFVDACDPVKYARQQPSGAEIDWVQTTARQFVMETAQTAEPEAVAA
ncbi:MAG TPA: hypothetical protein VMV81_06245 [Phycisphaerae bacterium]|nr:hypothetical protein [Phycisphaerae bacterium]